jgi:hypothetical protein
MMSGGAANRPLSMFISYASADEHHLQSLEGHLTVLVKRRLITPWSRKDLMAGDRARSETLRKLRDSDIILFLISADEIQSDDFWDVEMPTALDRYRKSEAVVIPILIRKVFWEGTEIAKLQVLPRNNDPVENWASKDEAYSQITAEISDIINSVLQKRKAKSQYKQYLESLLGSEPVITAALERELAEFAQDLPLNNSEISQINDLVLQEKRLAAQTRLENLGLYGRFYRSCRQENESLAILNPKLNSKASELSLSRDDDDVKEIERDIEKELFPELDNGGGIAAVVERISEIFTENPKLKLWLGAAATTFLLIFFVPKLLPEAKQPQPGGGAGNGPEDIDKITAANSTPTIEITRSVIENYLEAKEIFFDRYDALNNYPELMATTFVTGSPQWQQINDLIYERRQRGEYTKFYRQSIDESRNFSASEGSATLEVRVTEAWARCLKSNDTPTSDAFPRQDTTWYQAFIQLEDDLWKVYDIRPLESLNNLDQSRKNNPLYNVQYCSDLQV